MYDSILRKRFYIVLNVLKSLLLYIELYTDGQYGCIQDATDVEDSIVENAQRLFYPVTFLRYLVCFQHLSIINTAIMNICAHESLTSSLSLHISRN